MRDIPGYESWTAVEPLDGGFSRDEKFRVVDAVGQSRLLVISEGGYSAEKEREFNLLKQLKQMDASLPIPEALSCGLCDEGFYQLLSWQTGTTLDAVGNGDFRALGLEAGGILRRLHDAGANLDVKNWFREYDLQKLLDRKVRLYYDSELNLRDDEEIIDFLMAGAAVQRRSPIVLLHGDFHMKNLVLDAAGRLAVIDFNRMKPGPAPLDFARLEVYSRPVNPQFCDAIYEGYCGGCPTPEFLEAARYFAVFEAFFNVQWQALYGQEAVAVAKKTLKRIWQR